MTTRVLRIGRAAVARCAAVAAAAQLAHAPALPARNSLVLDQLVIFSDTPLPQASSPARRAASCSGRWSSTKLGAAGLRRADPRLPVSHGREASRPSCTSHYPELPDATGLLRRNRHAADRLCLLGRSRGRGSAARSGARLFARRRAATCRCGSTKGWPNISKCRAGRRGLNRPHVEQLATELSRGWQPESAAARSNCESAGEMTQADYAESWAWVHFLLETTPERRHAAARLLADRCCSRPTDRSRSCGSPPDRTAVDRLRARSPGSARTVTIAWPMLRVKCFAIEHRRRRPGSKPRASKQGSWPAALSSATCTSASATPCDVQCRKASPSRNVARPCRRCVGTDFQARRGPRRALPKCAEHRFHVPEVDAGRGAATVARQPGSTACGRMARTCTASHQVVRGRIDDGLQAWCGGESAFAGDRRSAESWPGRDARPASVARSAIARGRETAPASAIAMSSMPDNSLPPYSPK